MRQCRGCSRGALGRVAFAILLGLILSSTPRVLLLHAAAAEINRYQPPAPPAISAAAVFVTDITSGTELFALGPDTPLPPASLTKIVSALVILERANLEEEVEIVAEDLVSPEESQVGLMAGDRLSVRDLLFGALIPSGNDATLALARHVGEPLLDAPANPDQAVAKFVSLMNEKAAALGAKHSYFANPTGIDAVGHVMSARDVAIVTAAALKDPLFTEIVSTPAAVLDSEIRPDGYAVQTTNLLLAEGIVNGVKTGSTPAAGGCLVTSFLVGANTVIAVVLGSVLAETTEGLQDNSARFTDTRALLDAVSLGYSWLDPVAPGTVDGLLEELGVWQVGLPEGILLPVPTAATSQIRYRLVLGPPASTQDSAGEVQFYVDDRLLSEQAAVQIG